MAKILVIGATGLIGSAVASALAARNEVIKAARTPADGVEAVDISKPDSIASLFARIGTVDGIICAAGSAPMVPWSDVTTQVLMAGLGGKPRWLKARPAAGAGYDLNGIRPMLDQLSGKA